MDEPKMMAGVYLLLLLSLPLVASLVHGPSSFLVVVVIIIIVVSLVCLLALTAPPQFVFERGLLTLMLQLIFQTLHIAQFPNLGNFAIQTSKLGGTTPTDDLTGGRKAHQGGRMTTNKLEPDKGLVAFDDHAVNFTMIVGQCGYK